MTDIASLILQVDSTQAATGTVALNNLTTAAKAAAPAVTALSAAGAPAAAGMAKLTAVAEGAEESLRGQHEALRGLATDLSLIAPQLGSAAATAASLYIENARLAEGFGGVEKAIGAMLGAISPATAAIGLMVAAGAAAAVALTQWADGQRKVEIGLLGVGKASRASISDINEIAEATAALRGLSAAQAREAATAFAATGQIGVSNIGLLTGSVKSLSVALGVDVPQATELMAKAFADPMTGAKELATRLGGLDAATLHTIQNLQEAGNKQGAVSALAQAVLPNIQRASELTGIWANAWNVLGNAASNAFESMGKGLSRLGGGGMNSMSEDELQNKRKVLEDEIASLQSANIPHSGVTGHVNQLASQLFAVNEALMRVQTSAKDAKTELEKLQSLQLRNTFDQFLPEIGAQQSLLNAQSAIGGATGNDSLLARLGLTPDQISRAKSIVDDLAGHFKTAFQAAETQSQIAMMAVIAFSPGAKATIAQLQTIEQLRARQDLSPEEKLKLAQDAYNLSLKQTLTGLSEVSREQLLSASLGTDAARAQLSTIGQSIGATYQLQAIEQARATLLQQAARDRIAFDTGQFERLKQQIGLTANLKQLEAERKTQSDLLFQGTQLGNTDTEQKVATALRQLYGDNYSSQLNGAIADQIRYNDVLSQTKTTADSALSSFIKDLAQGKSGVQALHDVLGILEEKLISMISNQAISQLLKLLPSVGGGGVGTLPSGAYGTFGIHHTGGIVGAESGPMRTVPLSVFSGAPRFHEGGLVSGDVPIIAQKGEMILTHAQQRALAPAGGGGGNRQVVTIHNYSGGETKTQQRSLGGVDYMDVIIGRVGAAMAGGAFDGPLRSRTGQSLQPRGR